MSYIIIILIFLSFGITKSQIVLNEIAASNFRNFYDEDYDDSDWIELYNKSDEPVNLKGWKIYDKDELDNAFVLPDTIIQPKERIVIFASGKDRYSSNKLYAKTSGLGMMAHVKGTYVHYLYIPINEDFEAELQVDNVNSKQLFPTAGILFKEELSTNSKFYSIVASNRQRGTITTYYGFSEEENPIQYLSGFTESPITKIKLIKIGNVIKSLLLFHDGFTWHERSSDTLDFDSGYLGISFGGEDYKYELFSDFVISNFKINGKEYFYNDLEITDIGLPEGISTSYLLKEIHTNFAISKDGESVYLWNEENELIDNVSFKTQYTNLTFSRFPDGESKFYFSEPTPRNENNPGFDSIIPPPYFTDKSTIGKQLSKVEIEHENPKVEIYYTLDGSEPTKESYFYQNQILLDTGIVIRAKAFLNNAKSFNDAVFTYKPDYNYNVPYFNIIVDTNELYKPYYGLLIEDVMNSNEISCYFDYIDEYNNYFYQNQAGLRLHGRGTREFYPQKSFRFYHRKFSKNNYFENLFWNNNIESQRFILKSGGQDWEKNFVRDNLTDEFIKKLNSIDYENNTYVLSFINNSFYGIKVLKERIDDEFLHLKYNLNDKNKINIIQDINNKNGNLEDIINYIKVIKENNFDENFIYKNFDIDNLINYSFIRFFTSCYDWPYFNVMLWQSNEYDEKWRFIPNDFDWSMNFKIKSYDSTNTFQLLKNDNVIKAYNPFYVNLLFKYLENNENREYFATFFADRLNSEFISNNTINTLDSLINIVRPLVNIQKEIYPNSLNNFEEEYKGLRFFLQNRPKFLFEHIVEEFELSGTNVISLNSNIENAGRFQVNSIEISESSWTGTYFNEIPISVSVKSNPGYRFIGWKNLETQDSVLKDVLITDIKNFNAVFERTGEPIENPIEKIVINEIMYRSADNQKCGDWVELYNAGNIDVDLSGWYLKDGNFANIYTFPEGTTLRKEEYMIIAENVLDFKKYYGLNGNIIGDFDFGFGTDDMIRVYDDNDYIIDQVAYSNIEPWDKGADKTGYSLELINPFLDNTLPWNWIASGQYSGTPLEQNSKLISNVRKDDVIKLYPNPIKDKLFIELENNHFSDIEVYDVKGNKLINLQNQKDTTEIDFSEYSSGIYVIKISSINKTNEYKIIKE